MEMFTICNGEFKTPEMKRTLQLPGDKHDSQILLYQVISEIS